MTPAALVGSNVVIAAIVMAHQHHAASSGLLHDARMAVAAHSYAEAFNTLTRLGPRGAYRYPPAMASAALDTVASLTTLIGLTPGQTLAAVRAYAADGNIGARVYDWLIGQAALMHGIPAVITWNAGHMRSLFPGLRVETPESWTP